MFVLSPSSVFRAAPGIYRQTGLLQRHVVHMYYDGACSISLASIKAVLRSRHTIFRLTKEPVAHMWIISEIKTVREVRAAQTDQVLKWASCRRGAHHFPPPPNSLVTHDSNWPFLAPNLPICYNGGICIRIKVST